jgi:predicted type IV restriction endonuclease
MVVLSSLLDLADFYLYPFHIKSEQSVQIEAEDEGVTVKGNIDVLVICEQVTVAVIESKQAAFSVEVAKAQLLSYMLAFSNSDEPVYGLITNGASFLFVKLIKQEAPKYLLSRLFYIFNPGNDLYIVLSILKRLGELATVVR